MLNHPLVRFQQPSLPSLDEVARYFSLSEEAGWFSNFGPCCQLLEERLSAYLGLTHRGLTVSNATLGLVIALQALIEGSGRYVAVPSFTFAASANAILLAGHKPLFLDINPDDWQADEASLEALSAVDGLGGVMLCSTFGTALTSERRAAGLKITERLGVPVIVDSAAGFGSEDERGAKLGHNGHAEIFSFHATKPFAIGEGGFITSPSQDVLDKMRKLTNFGFGSDRVVEADGTNAKMSEVHAATGLCVLDQFEDILKGRRESGNWLLSELNSSGFTSATNVSTSAFQFVPVACPDAVSRNAVIADAARSRVEVRTYFAPALHQMPFFSDFPTIGRLRVTEDLAGRILSLPMSNALDPLHLELVRDVCLRNV